MSNCSPLWTKADTAHCETAVCTLEGNVWMQCGEARLVASSLALTFDNDKLVRVEAHRDVRMAEGTKLLEAESLHLRPDADGDIHAFVFRQKPPGALLQEDALQTPLGHDELVLCGKRMARSTQGDVQLRDAAITLCDCGVGKRPSWRLRAPRVEVKRGQKRANIYWPRLEANVLGLFLLPITPPLLPLSVPLTARAVGLLPPELQFLGPPYPTIDLPVFVPLGPSYDLTITPGVRSDWAGAPRLGVRFRAHPTEQLYVKLQLHDTWDPAHAMAKRRREFDFALAPGLAGDPLYQQIDAQRRRLVHRVSASLQLQWHKDRKSWHHQQGEGAAHHDVFVEAAALSDDLVYRDLSILPIERSMAYLPSRALYTMRSREAVGSLGFDALQNLISVETIDGRIVPMFSNVHGKERGTLHRGPAVRLVVPRKVPFERWPHLYVAGEASLSRYGPFPGVKGHLPSERARQLALADRQVVLGATATVGMARRIGVVRARLSARADALFVDEPGLRPLFVVTPVADAEAGLMLVRRFGHVWHDISPFIAFRHLQQRKSAADKLTRRAALGLDERTERRLLTQVVFGVRQSLWRGSAARAAPLLRFEASLPVDVGARTLLQPWLRLTLDDPRVGQLMAQSSLDVHRFGERPADLAFRELDASYARALGPLVGTLGYVRLAPDSDRLLRSLYDLAGPRRPVDPFAPWVHTLRVGAMLSWRQRINGAANVLLQLPRPETRQLTNLVLPRPPRNARAVQVASVMVSVGYASPCRCWSAEVVLGAAPQDFLRTFRFAVLLNVAGFRVGTPSKE